MPRYSRIFLTPKQLSRHGSRLNPTPLFIRHCHALQVRAIFLGHCPPLSSLPPHTVPSVLRLLVSRANHDLHLKNAGCLIDPLSLWRIIHRAHIQHLLQSPTIPPNHDAIYVFDRFPCCDERRTPHCFVRRHDPSNTIIPSSSTLVYQNCTFVLQPSGKCLIYLVQGLHYKRHGLTHTSRIPSHEATLNSMSITTASITHPLVSRNHKRGTCTKNGITVMDSHYCVMSKLHSSLPLDFLHFHNALATHMITKCTQVDKSRVDGKIDRRRTSLNLGLRFGFRREQRDCSSTHYFRGHKLPTINVGPYLQCSNQLRSCLVKVLETGSKIVRQQNPNSFSDPHRSAIFASRLNTKLGVPQSTNQFEFVDIVLSSNTVLPAHLDTCNDHRPGYDSCLVYTFSTNVDGKVCRVAMIMTTRTSVGACLHKINTNKSKVVK